MMNKVQTVTKSNKKNEWEIRFIRNGVPRVEKRKTEALARQRALYWENIFAGGGSDDDHPVRYWEAKLREAAHLLDTPDGVAKGKVLASIAAIGLKAAALFPPLVVDGEEKNPVTEPDAAKMTTEELESHDKPTSDPT